MSRLTRRACVTRRASEEDRRPRVTNCTPRDRYGAPAARTLRSVRHLASDFAYAKVIVVAQIVRPARRMLRRECAHRFYW